MLKQYKILEQYKITAFCKGKNTFLSGNEINFMIKVDTSSDDVPENVALMWLSSIIKEDTEVEIINVIKVNTFKIK